MARLVSLVLLSAWQADPARAEDACSPKCEKEFTEGCWAGMCSKGKSPREAYDICKGHLEAGSARMARFCSKTCKMTDAMHATANSTCSSSEGVCSRRCATVFGACQAEACKQGLNSSGAFKHCEDRRVARAREFVQHCKASCTLRADMRPRGKKCSEHANCADSVEEKPSVPTLCSPKNQGCCRCDRSSTIETLVWWIGQQQYCMLRLSPRGYTLGPIILSFRYNAELESVGWALEAADYYGLTVLRLTGPGDGPAKNVFSLPAIVNDMHPTPCTRQDSEDYEYLESVFRWIEGEPNLKNQKIYLEGVKKDAFAAFYASVCFASKIAGVWQGGGGMVKTGHRPLLKLAWSAHCGGKPGKDCCEQDFCTSCQYWPVYPRTCGNKLTTCIQAYTEDQICGAAWYQYEAMVAEGNDARLLLFPYPSEATGREVLQEPYETWAWKVSCLGMVDSCSEGCAQDFKACADGYSGSGSERFKECERRIQDRRLPTCAFGCAPTLSMLRISEDPDMSFSEGKFGMQTNLPIAPKPTPEPACEIGPVEDLEAEGCPTPAGWTIPESKPASCTGTPGSSYPGAASPGDASRATDELSFVKFGAVLDIGVLLLIFVAASQTR